MTKYTSPEFDSNISPVDGVLDNYTVVASRALNCSISLITLVDEATRLPIVRSQTGLPATLITKDRLPCGHVLCDMVVSRNMPVVVTDMMRDPLTKNEKSFRQLGLHAYMGVPVHAPDGHAVGALCVLQTHPRNWTDADLDTLRRLGETVSAQIGLGNMAQQLQRSREALAEENDNFSNFLETVASGVVVFNDEGRFLYANKECQRILGLKLSEIIGRAFDDLEWRIEAVDGGEFPTNELPFMQVKKSGRSVRDVRFAIQNPDGSRRVLSVNASPSRRASDDTSVICDVRDVTDQLRHEEMLQSAVTRAEDASRAKSSFLTNISHEIRTPLNGIMGTADLLSDMGVSQAQREMLDTIQTSGDTLLRLINGLLDLSRIEAGKVELEENPCDVGKLAQQICRLHSAEALSQGVELKVDIVGEDKGTRLADELRLSQILGNLIGNALKFTEKGHVHLSVDLRQEDMLSCTVQDSGIGMTKDQLEKVFETFEQADGSIARRFGGTGLGLSIVQHLVNLMDGHIGIESQFGLGTTVSLELPIQIAQPENEMSQAQLDREYSFQKLRVLVADDAQVNRKLLATMLARLGAEVTLVEDGADAVAHWKPGIFDVLILDISMPNLDGVSALEAIHTKAQNTAGHQVVAIAATANVQPEQKARYREVGFASVLEKPYRLSDLRHALQTAMNTCDSKVRV